MAFLTKVKANKNTYFYITIYKKRENYCSKNEERIFSLGCEKKAKKILEKWNKNFNKVPKDLLEKGLEKENLTKWINSISNT